MKRLARIYVILHQMGINTKTYKKYVWRLQKTLDKEHLSNADWLNKYYSNHILV